MTTVHEFQPSECEVACETLAEHLVIILSLQPDDKESLAFEIGQAVSRWLNHPEWRVYRMKEGSEP